MQFVMARGALQKELAFVQGVVERKNTIPVRLLQSQDSPGRRVYNFEGRIWREYSKGVLGRQSSPPSLYCYLVSASEKRAMMTVMLSSPPRSLARATS